MNLNRMTELIWKVARSEEDALRQLDEGIFKCGERALAYLIGKEILKQKEQIFPEADHIRWEPEIELGNGGPTDLAFLKENDPVLVIEMKMHNTYSSYVRDIEKLNRRQTPGCEINVKS